MRATDIERYRLRLLELQARLRGDVDQLHETALSGSDGERSRTPVHMAELGTSTSIREFALCLSEAELRTLREVEAALERIRAGTYGRCMASGKQIPKARLDAIPYAAYCVEYAEQAEQPEGLARLAQRGIRTADHGDNDS